MTSKEIGDKIRTMRKSRGWTQGQLADLVGVSESAVGMWESGRRRPGDSAIEALADVFNVPKWAIEYNEDEMMPISEQGQPPVGGRTVEARNVSGWMDNLPKWQRKFLEDMVASAIANFPKG